MLTFHTGADLFSKLLPANVMVKAAEDGLNVWITVIHVEEQDEALSSCLQPGSTLTIMVIWRVNLQIEDLPLCLLISV